MIQASKRSNLTAVSLLWAYSLMFCAFPAVGGVCTCGCGSSPLILDLEIKGSDIIITTDLANGVVFDLDADGIAEEVGWTFGPARSAFLFLDLNGNGKVDDGRELFGNSTILPNGTTASNGFEALAVFDRVDQGGNNDLKVTSDDSIWSSLRLWIDWSHDGTADPDEISTLDDFSIVSIELDYVETSFVDGVGNAHKFKGSFVRATDILNTTIFSEHLIEDIFFVNNRISLIPQIIFIDGFESGDFMAWSEICEGIC